VMVLGYPGRTFRHKTSHYMRVQEQIQLPYIAGRFEYMIQKMEEVSRNDRGLQLRFASQIKSYANVSKNYRGKLQGLRRLHLVEKKIEQERQLQAFIEKDPALKAKYGTVLSDIAGVYDRYAAVCKQELLVSQLNRNRLVSIAQTVLASVEDAKRSAEALASTRATLASQFYEMHNHTELDFLITLIRECEALPADQQFIGSIKPFSTTPGIIDPIDPMLPNTIFASREQLLGALDMKKADLTNDPFIRLAVAMQAINQTVRERTRTRDGELNRLEALLLDAKMAWQNTGFIPDANSTLRLTYGYVRGYTPADATRYAPFTTLKGIIEKNTGADPFEAPPELVKLYETRSYDKAFEDKALKDVPVAMIYNLDTTGGNSGSPVMNARGELVGVNFDRAYEATINDYQWSEDYSRSIAVDIRYVLFIAKYLGHADFLLKELGV
jgi:hypothetical protein